MISRFFPFENVTHVFDQLNLNEIFLILFSRLFIYDLFHVIFSFNLEKLAEEPAKVVVVKPAVVANVNKWEGEDEDDIKVS